MGRYEYRAIDQAGKVLVGVIEADTVADVLAELDRAGATPIATREARGAVKARGWRERLTPDPKPEHVTAFTTDLSMLLKGGVILGEALQILGQLEKKPWLRRLIADLKADITAGKSFSAALGRYPQQFPPIYVKTVEVAEAAGRLDDALSGLARERQRGEAMRKRFISAISYPLFLVVAALGVLCFVLLYIIPQFEVAISSFRDRMDPSALFVFNLSRAFRANTDVMLVGAATLLAAFVVAQRVAREKALGVMILSKLPLIRTILAYDETVTFCRTLAILVDNGVDISAALRLIRGVVRLPASAAKIDTVLADVRQGRRLSDALQKAAFMPHHVVQMLRIGEESGKLGEGATRIAGLYETRLDASLGRLTAVLGPVLMIAVSVLIAWVIISVMSALISINDLLV